MPMTDDTDARVIKETLTRTYTYVGSRSGIKGQIDEEADAGGFEVFPEVSYADDFDSDLDGMPNWWENIKGTNANSAPGDFTESNTDSDGDGFTAHEDYLDFKANPNYLIAADATVEIDVAGLFLGYTKAPTYTVENCDKQLRVSIEGCNIIVRPLADNFIGEFSVRVTDGDNHTYLRRIFVAVGTNEVDNVNPITISDAQLKSYEVYGVNGNIIKSGNCNSGDTYNTLPLGNLFGGVYLMKTTDVKGKVKTYKVVKR